MKRLAALFFLFAMPIFAHTASISWTNSPDTSSTNVYRLAGSCPAGTAGFTKITASPVTTGTYTDPAVTPGAYCYYVTATLNGVESIPSNTIQANVPVAPPSGLTITSVAKVINSDGTETFTAKWSDTNISAQQTFAFSNGTSIINQGLTSSLTGTFSEQATVPSGTAIVFLVSDATGSQASESAN